MGEGWNWWAGRTAEWMDMGSHATREDAVAEGMGYGDGDFVVLEARSLSVPSPDAGTVIDDWLNGLGENHDYYSGESGYPEWTLPKDQQKVAEAELQTALAAWAEKWARGWIDPLPDIFGDVRNQETIRNTRDPDMEPGGHDNPQVPA